MGSLFSRAGQPEGANASNAAGQRRDLVQSAQAGDRAAFGELFDLYVGRVYEFVVYQVDGHVELAQDVTEQVFLDALQALPGWRADVPFSAWLYRLASRRLSARLNGGARPTPRA